MTASQTVSSGKDFHLDKGGEPQPEKEPQENTATSGKKGDDASDEKLTATTKSLKWLLGTNYGDQPLYRRLNYLHLVLLFSTPVIALVGFLTLEKWYWQTFVFAIVYYYFTAFGITAGYHRLFAHRAYEATTAVKVLLLLMGAGAFEGSCRWWARDHRAHHRYVDSPKDPYSFKNGFWYAHIGWMLVKQDKTKIGKAECDDLYEDPWITWQHKNYLIISLFCAFIFPTLVAGLGWGDYSGGYFIVGVARLVFVHHSTFFVNSLAHYAGHSTYSDQHTAKNSVITALLTAGEGYHNFHHEFPSDYRNGVEWYQYDPTKVFIRLLSYFGLTYNLKRFPQNEINKGMLQMKMKSIEHSMSSLYWGPKDSDLFEISFEGFKRKVAEEGKKWTVLHGFVLDLTNFVDEHPGGKKLINAYVGKDATNAFVSSYRHSIAAKNLQVTFRVGRIVESDSRRKDD